MTLLDAEHEHYTQGNRSLRSIFVPGGIQNLVEGTLGASLPRLSTLAPLPSPPPLRTLRASQF
ncbi:predicted protein [Plenodomus lingam JN3]|uniref:Predicted protein n=1 Tax=Leptosphaeria maculans (strain JN3 / isolate v23.1.3 / race Av1-4-5-6-7-8) TaxID=985895 RepID=E4ZNZ2_LEPMJ|nr:predicted protein [Plenodomus lingam JN3]CBX93361.1 predicted protein [Plenodomus lingam JN3]